MSLNTVFEITAEEDKKLTIENFELKIYLPQECINSSISVSEGDFEFNSSWLIWTIKKVKSLKELVLKGNIATTEPFASKSTLILNCELSNYSALGNRISKLNILKDKENAAPYKGGMNTTIIQNLQLTF